MEPEPTMYTKQLVFNNRFRAASKGSLRPTICSMDWNLQCEGFEEMMAFSSGELIRAFGRKGKTWKMLMNRKPSGARKVNALKWSPQLGSCLAVATGDGRRVTIDFLHFIGRRFKKIKRFEVPEAGSVSSLSWDHSGKYLVAPIKRDSHHREAQMVVIKKQGKNRFRERRIYCGYQSAFTSVFHPTRTCILSTSITSTEILVWSEDAKSFEWKIEARVSCDSGITEMCLSKEATYLAAIVAKRLMIWLYCDEDEDGNECHPRLEERQYASDDGINWRKGVSLSKHCANIISLKWSSQSDLLTGSSVGTFCVHAPLDTIEDVIKLYGIKNIYFTCCKILVFKFVISCLQIVDLNSPFDVLYFRWSHVHAQNTSGPVNCVAWIPELTPPQELMLALAGNDGVVTVWELVDLKIKNLHNRNYVKEINYFYPGRKCPAFSAVREHDVDSIESISVCESKASSEGEDTSEKEGDELLEEEQSEEQQQSGAISVRSRVRKVLEKQEDIKTAVTEVLEEVQGVLDKLIVLEGIADDHDEKLSGLITDGADAKQNQEDLEESMKELLCTVEEIMSKLANLEAASKNNKTEVTCALQEVVMPRLNQLEEVIKLQKAEMVAAVQEVLKKSNEHEIVKVDKNELPSKIQSRLNEMEERNLVKQNQMEGSVLSRLNQMESSVLSRLNQMESSVLSRLNQMEERHLILTQKIDSMKDL